MQAVYRNNDIAQNSPVYHNRPSPPGYSTPAASLSDAVYVVDDDASIAGDILMNLGMGGTKVIGFASATDYLAFAGNDAAACVVINSRMPDLSGLELQSKLAARGNPPVIFISDQSDITSAVCAMKAGAIDFLIKPVDLRALIAAIRIGLAQDRRLRQRKAEVAELRTRFSLLTPREREVLPLVIGGLLNKQAASILCISEVTLQIHRSQVMRKMRAESLAELVRMALKLRIPHWCEHPLLSLNPQ